MAHDHWSRSSLVKEALGRMSGEMVGQFPDRTLGEATSPRFFTVDYETAF